MLKKLLGKSDFVKNSSILMGGTLLAQLLPVALQPFLRRIFTPEEFSLFAIYFSIVSILALAASFQYHVTVVLPKEDEDALGLVKGGVVLSVIFSSIILGVVYLFSDPIFEFFNFLTEKPTDLY